METHIYAYILAHNDCSRVSHCVCRKQIKPVRLLEAHMACLRQEFESWAEHEPEEPESDKPTDEENAAFEAAEEAHEQNVSTSLRILIFTAIASLTHISLQFQALQTQAQRLSASLGVGKLSDPILANALLGFVREGIRFAFSRDVPGSDEVLFLGARLPFLRILAKYVLSGFCVEFPLSAPLADTSHSFTGTWYGSGRTSNVSRSFVLNST
jgi:hypothetical protein